MRYNGPIQRSRALRLNVQHAYSGMGWQEDGGLTILAASSVHLYDVRVVDLLQQSEF